MSIKKTKTNKYYVDVRDVYGRRVRKVFDKKQDAAAFEVAHKKEKYENKLVAVSLKKKRYLISKSLDDFALIKSSLRPKSIQKYNCAINEIRKFCLAMKLVYIDEFTFDHATLFYNELLKERTIDRCTHTILKKAAPKTVNFYIATLKAFFKEELIRNHIDRDPTIHIKNVKTNRKKPEFYTEKVLNDFFSQKMNPSYRNFFLGLLYSGMRYSEAANLTWDDIDFDRKLIYVREKTEHMLKTLRSERAIPMNNHLYELLSDAFHRRSSEFVFPNSQNTMMKERRALAICKAIALKAGINSRAYLHKFRSTYATHLIRNNVPLEAIKELLGHTSIIITEQAYANNESSHLHSNVRVLDTLLLNEQYQD